MFATTRRPRARAPPLPPTRPGVMSGLAPGDKEPAAACTGGRSDPAAPQDFVCDMFRAARKGQAQASRAKMTDRHFRSWASSGWSSSAVDNRVPGPVGPSDNSSSPGLSPRFDPTRGPGASPAAPPAAAFCQPLSNDEPAPVRTLAPTSISPPGIPGGDKARLADAQVRVGSAGRASRGAHSGTGTSPPSVPHLRPGARNEAGRSALPGLARTAPEGRMTAP